jgi:hypothetical protein
MPQARVRREWRSIVQRRLSTSDIEVTRFGIPIALVVSPETVEATHALAEYLDACAVAAHDVETVAPEIAMELKALGWNDDRRGQWLIEQSMPGDVSPLELIRKGQSEVVLEWLRRAHYGFTA